MSFISGQAQYHGLTRNNEYIAVVGCPTQVVWLRSMLDVLNDKQNTPTTIFCHKSTIALWKNPMFDGRSKHIDLWFHMTWELVIEKEVLIYYCCTDEQIVNIFIKLLKIELFYKLKKYLKWLTLQVWFKGGNVSALNQAIITSSKGKKNSRLVVPSSHPTITYCLPKLSTLSCYHHQHLLHIWLFGFTCPFCITFCCEIIPIKDL